MSFRNVYRRRTSAPTCEQKGMGDGPAQALEQDKQDSVLFEDLFEEIFVAGGAAGDEDDDGALLDSLLQEEQQANKSDFVATMASEGIVSAKGAASGEDAAFLEVLCREDQDANETTVDAIWQGMTTVQSPRMRLVLPQPSESTLYQSTFQQLFQPPHQLKKLLTLRG